MPQSPAKQRERRAARWAAGVCAECPEPALPGRSKCWRCIVYHRVSSRWSQRRKVAARRRDGLCLDCGVKVDGEDLYCPTHLPKAQAWCARRS